MKLCIPPVSSHMEEKGRPSSYGLNNRWFRFCTSVKSINLANCSGEYTANY